ncbi:hypothetical protein H0H93_011969 [Arthromyces matolae]|nr:hypothetical protein H0H93_011969 [Arthromyces matolae]
MSPSTQVATKCRSSVSREARAMIRIMFKRGVKAAVIAQRVSVATRTVYRVLSGASGGNDDENDWDHVSSAFAQEFPPPQVDSESSTDDETSPTPSPRPETRLLSFPSPPAIVQGFVPPEVSENERSIDSHAINTLRAATPNLPITSRYKHEPKSEDLRSFLKGLEHDLSYLVDILEAQGITSLSHLLAFAPWPERRLHQMFTDIPQITVPQRFILVHGLKNFAE